MRLVEIHVYPLKGAGGIALERADVLAGGLRHDRRFMLLGADGSFLTQRQHPELALVTAAFTSLADGTPALAVGTPGGGAPTVVSLSPDAGPSKKPRRTVRVWDDDVEAIDVEGPIAERLSEHLGARCSLVFMPDDVVRPVEEPYGAPGDRVGFADGFPVLLAANASLADLNARLATPVPMNRFRPNLVVDGGAAYDEERFGRARVGDVVFRMPKRCARCSVTTVDQRTAEVGKEPLRTLAAYRTESNKVYFAQNLIPEAAGTIAVGDEVVYLS
ncbi:MAG: Flavodoxin reductase [Labilithrix sp.]|nr:Flavodoxin reductase [Labilithrix sp.]